MQFCPHYYYKVNLISITHDSTREIANKGKCRLTTYLMHVKNVSDFHNYHRYLHDAVLCITIIGLKIFLHNRIHDWLQMKNHPKSMKSENTKWPLSVEKIMAFLAMWSSWFGKLKTWRCSCLCSVIQDQFRFNWSRMTSDEHLEIIEKLQFCLSKI